MRLLRITQSALGNNRYRAELRVEGDGVPFVATAEFSFQISAQDREDLRWYLEDYLQYPQDPAPRVAGGIERRMAAAGTELFRSVFHANDNARDLWALVRGDLNETRVEVITPVEEAFVIPWELMRDPSTDTPVALRSKAFVRAQPQASQRPEVPQSANGPIRILLVICRPGGGLDVPFRSVATQLIKGLNREARAASQLDVLRPPTFEQLARVLRQSKSDGNPYHIVHFDGHGVYADMSAPGQASQFLRCQGSIVLGGNRAGKHGYLLFEDPADDGNAELVDGPTIGGLLAETRVPVLVLNACRSAHADSPVEPQNVVGALDNPHAQIRSYGSLAQEVMDAGVAGVVAMRYSVYVVTAAQFVANLYAMLAQGRSLGEAVTLGRKQLAEQPNREIAFQRRPLQDWCVPIVYEAVPIALARGTEIRPSFQITRSRGQRDGYGTDFDDALPKSPDAGFFGRDEVLLAIDRAFDEHAIVLLHAFAGSGKTATSAEFARWYANTGGVQGPVLFSAFEYHLPLARLLDRIGQQFASILERSGIHWLTLDDAQRRVLALDVLRKVPVLWIWDNVEPVAGLPQGREAAWSKQEQQELADFLRDAQHTRAKFLLTSRREEYGWLGNLPRRISMPPMPMQERVQLVRALAERHGRRLTDVVDWRPLLQFTQGNPLTITVLVSQALRDGVRTKEEIEQFVAALRAGEGHFGEEASDGRTRSLGASLEYGFGHSFSHDERQQLVAISLFEGCIGTGVLGLMGNEDFPWCVEEIRGCSAEYWIALLNRAVEIGLLERRGPEAFSVHPAVPWFLRSTTESAPEMTARFEKAFVGAMDYVGGWLQIEYANGRRDASYAGAFVLNEQNFRRAYSLAKHHSLYQDICGLIGALSTLYIHTGRRIEWHRLLREFHSDVADPDTGVSRPGREECWRIVEDLRAIAAGQVHDFSKAERIASRLVAEYRSIVAPFRLSRMPGLSHLQRLQLGALAESLVRLGEYQSNLGKPEGLVALDEAYAIAIELGDANVEATAAYYLGVAYEHVEAVKDLDKADHWYCKSLELRGTANLYESAKCLHQRAGVAFERFKRASKEGDDRACFDLLNQGIDFINGAFSLTAPDSVDDLARMHCMAGLLLGNALRIAEAREHYAKSIALDESQGNLFWASKTREFFAIDLARQGMFEESLQWAQAALDGFTTYGASAARETESIEGFVHELIRLQEKRSDNGR